MSQCRGLRSHKQNKEPPGIQSLISRRPGTDENEKRCRTFSLGRFRVDVEYSQVLCLCAFTALPSGFGLTWRCRRTWQASVAWEEKAQVSPSGMSTPNLKFNEHGRDSEHTYGGTQLVTATEALWHLSVLRSTASSLHPPSESRGARI